MEHPEEFRFSEMRKLVGDRKFNSILEVGCGDGNLASRFVDTGAKILAVDKDDVKLYAASKLYPDVEYKLVNLINYNLEGNHDLVIFADVIYYLPLETQIKIMNEIYYVLNEGGLLLTSRHTDNEAELNNYQHLFEKIESKRINNPKGSNFWTITLWKKISGVSNAG